MTKKFPLLDSWHLLVAKHPYLIQKIERFLVGHVARFHVDEAGPGLDREA